MAPLPNWRKPAGGRSGRPLPLRLRPNKPPKRSLKLRHSSSRSGGPWFRFPEPSPEFPPEPPRSSPPPRRPHCGSLTGISFLGCVGFGVSCIVARMRCSLDKRLTEELEAGAGFCRKPHSGDITTLVSLDLGGERTAGGVFV